VPLTRLRWIFLVAAVAFLGIVEVSRFLVQPYVGSWGGHLLVSAVVLVGTLFLIGAGFELIARMQRRLERQNRELLALHEASTDLYGDLGLEKVLQKVVDQARQLLDARYGALSVVDAERRIEQFVVSGLDAETIERLGEPPRGHGLLGVVLDHGERLRLADLGRDPRSAGFPEHHPEMHSLLAVPVDCNGPFRGNLYLAEKLTADAFSDEDEETLERFAAAAAAAIDSVYLHLQLQTLALNEERLRIAREMHDGMAQMVAYVNAKAQAVQEFLARGRRKEADEHLAQLTAAARDAYAELREGILALRTRLDGDQALTAALAAYVASWREQSGVEASCEIDGEPMLAPLVELQLLRILQEALSNVRKHARAERVVVRMAQEDGRVYASVIDDGVGFNPRTIERSELPRFGLTIMRERAQAIGAELVVDSQPGEGTRVRVSVPVKARARHPETKHAATMQSEEIS